MNRLTQPGAIVSYLLAFMILAVLASSTVKAQPTPLTVTNTSPCPIWVNAMAASPFLACAPVCVTAWFPVPPGAVVSIPPCGVPGNTWILANYGMCGPPTPPPIGCAMGTTPNAIGTACGIAPVTPPDCTGALFAPIWTGVATFFF